MASPSPRAAQRPLAGATVCTDPWCTLPLNPTTYLLNNQWGTGTAHGSQTIRVNGPNAWATDYDWTRPEEWQVTTYAAAILGWHWGYLYEATGLPIPALGTERVIGDVAYTMTPANSPDNRYDVMFDCWCHAEPVPPADASAPMLELMIWLAYSQDYLGHGAPYLAEHPTLDGIQWKVSPATVRDHDGNGETDTVVFMVDGPNLSGGKINVNTYLSWIVAHRGLFPPSRILDNLHDWFLTGVEFGTEVYNGAGVLDVLRHDVRVEASANPTDELTTLQRVQLAALVLSDAARSGLEPLDPAITRAYQTADALWAARDR